MMKKFLYPVHMSRYRYRVPNEEARELTLTIRAAEQLTQRQLADLAKCSVQRIQTIEEEKYATCSEELFERLEKIQKEFSK